VSSVVFAQSEDAHLHHKDMIQQQEKSAGNFVGIDLPDATLVTQDGVEVSLANDVVGDKIVVIDFVYTTCTTVCPVLSAIFSQVQNNLGDRLGAEVVLVSISVDPLRDTPARLKKYAERLGAGDSWLWLTGRQQTVTEVLQELGAYTPNFSDHPSMVLVGDGQSGQWARFIGFPGADQIVKKVDEFSAVRMANLSRTAIREK
jgi:protein SCO1/2